MLDLAFARGHFPALDQGWALMDNAGGSVAPRQVIDRVGSYMRRYQVQLGASYGLSVAAGERVAEGRMAAAELIGAEAGEVILGPSTTINLELLAGALSPLFSPGDQLVTTNLDHEANVGVWRRLAASGDLEVREWRLRDASAALELEDLAALLTERTRLVCCTHCSNITGGILDVAAVARMAHDAGARVCVDGVAFAPHRKIDVRTLGADVYALSLYKTYGPHLGLLYVGRDLLATARSRNHFFVGAAKAHLKLEPGNVSYELAASLPGIIEYLEALDARHFPPASAAGQSLGPAGTEACPPDCCPPDSQRDFRQQRLSRVFGLIAEHEQLLATRLLDFLSSKPGARVIGLKSGRRERRVPTISFVVEGRKSSAIPPLLDRRKIALRWGHFYAYRSIRDLGLLAGDGVVRVSLVHYNTEAEVDRLIKVLDELL